ncbi:MAG: hypothetical protein HY722_04760 [Planctomycetes bacterium]|nr:hypothetical protein [Planctomycetota bacterium]
MSHGVSPHCIDAEIAAWPLWSSAAFGARTTHLGRTSPGVLDAGTQSLWDGLEEYLRTRSGSSLEVLRRSRDAVWFGGETSTEVGLHRVLAHLARGGDADRPGNGLVFYGGRVGIGDFRGRDPAEAAERWRWISFVLPHDTLIAACGASEGLSPTADRVSLAGGPVQNLLRDSTGVTEAHLHVAAAPPFEAVWARLMARIGHDAPPKDKLERGVTTDMPFDQSRAFVRYLALAGLVRLVLARFLQAERAGACRDFSAFHRSDLRRLCQDTVHARRVRGALRAIQGGARFLTLPEVQATYRQMIPTTPSARPPDTRRDLAAADPLAADGFGGRGVFPETGFLARAMGYLYACERRGSADGAFEAVFWQYVRVRCRTFRFLTEVPGTAGFEWFRRHFSRVAAFKMGLDERGQVCAVLDLESAGCNLRSLEVRMTPESEWDKVRNQIRAVPRAMKAWGGEPGAKGCANLPEAGVVFHLVKDEFAHEKQQVSLHADPRSSDWRFGRLAQAWRAQANALATAVRKHPELLVFARGGDVCNLELSVPTWVVVPFFEGLREASREASRMLDRQGERIDPFRFTLHVGEDYRRLVEGLRRIHEAIEFGLIREGDRVGHAIALGVDPAAWASVHGQGVRQPREERLDDLLWELDRYVCQDARERVADATGRQGPVAAEALRLAQTIYGDTAPLITDLVDARRVRHDMAFLRRIGFPGPPARWLHGVQGGVVGRRAQRLTLLYLTDRAVFARGQEPIEIRVEDREPDMLAAMQQHLRRRMAALDVTVECNPSSNLLIGGLGGLDDHPVFRFQPEPGGRLPEGPVVPVAFGDDNPITFNTCLPEECVHLYHALVRRGAGAQEAQEWLDRVQTNAWRARFTLPESREERWWTRVNPERRDKAGRRV